MGLGTSMKEKFAVQQIFSSTFDVASTKTTLPSLLLMNSPIVLSIIFDKIKGTARNIEGFTSFKAGLRYGGIGGNPNIVRCMPRHSGSITSQVNPNICANGNTLK